MNNSNKPQSFNAAGGGKNGGGDDDTDESGSGWISWFCDLEGHEFFIEVFPPQKLTLYLGG